MGGKMLRVCRAVFLGVVFLEMSLVCRIPAYAGEFEQTPGIYRHLPFLKPKARFWDVYPGGNPGHGEPHTLYAELSPGNRIALKKSADFLPFIAAISTKDQALQFVRFLSNPPAGLDHPIEPFQDVPFYELQTHMGSPQLGTTFTVSEHTLSVHGIVPPEVSEEIMPSGKKRFTIRRFVFPYDQIEEACKGKISKIGRVVETVEESGVYRGVLTPVPVENLEVQHEAFPLD